MVCPGGYFPLISEKGFWRESEDSLELVECILNREACLENSVCEEGHRGVLCEDCQNNYQRTSDF
jgi:hypothetical protein